MLGHDHYWLKPTKVLRLWLLIYLQGFTTWKCSKYSACCVTVTQGPDGEFLPRTKIHNHAANPRAIGDSVFRRDVSSVINFIVDNWHVVDLKL